MKGFVGFLPADVQMRKCFDLMEKIWKKEDAELKSRDELLVMLKASVAGFDLFASIYRYYNEEVS